MAPIFDVLSTVNGQLNIVSRHYNDRNSILRSLPSVPDFILGSLNKVVFENPDMVINDDSNIVIDASILADTGDGFNPVYVNIVSNINKAVVDKVPIIGKRKDTLSAAPGIAFLVYVPRILFDDRTDINDVSVMLKDIYFGLLKYDPNMEYIANPAILNVVGKKKIGSYDLAMTVVAICTMHINLRSWFGSGNEPLSARYTLNAFDEKEIEDNIKEVIIPIIETHGTTIGNLRDSIENGKLFIESWNAISDIYCEDESSEDQTEDTNPSGE